LLLYDNNFLQHLGKFHMHWLGPYVMRFVTEVGATQLEKPNGEVVEGLVNSSRIKPYRDNRASYTSLSAQNVYHSTCIKVCYRKKKGER
jgi:hypothetical protein